MREKVKDLGQNFRTDPQLVKRAGVSEAETSGEHLVRDTGSQTQARKKKKYRRATRRYRSEQLSRWTAASEVRV